MTETSAPTTPPTGPGFQVNPYRFTDRPDAMVAFLEALGLRIEASAADWADVVGAGGRVGVHSLASSSRTSTATALCLLTPDAAAAAAQLREAGLDARWWDESFGRQAAVRGPLGELTINEPMSDFHGYEQPDPTPRPSTPEVTVVAVYVTADLHAAADFFAAFGFRAREAAAGWWPMHAGETSGVIGLHASDRGPVPGDACALSFQTTEELPQLAQRLRGLGYDVREAYDADAPHVTVTDPDGELVEVHPR